MKNSIRFTYLLLFLNLCLSIHAEEIQNRYQLRGVLIEKNSNRVLKHIPINVLPYNRDVKTDNQGRFLLNMPAGEYGLVIDFYPYEKTEVGIHLKSDSTLTIYLKAPVGSHLLEEVNVLSVKSVNEQNTAIERIDKNWLDKLPSMIGEKDLLKTLALSSGVTSSSEGAADIQVRGGTHGQNLYLLDGVPLYSTSHFFGMVSAYNPTCIGSAELYKAAFPARFGGKVSSVLDVHTIDADLNKVKGEAEMGILASKASIHVPLIKGKLGFFSAGRISNYSLLNAVSLFTSAYGYKLNLFFRDLNANLKWKPTDHDELKLTWFSNSDKFNANQPDGGLLIMGKIENSQHSASLHWKRIFSDKLQNDFKIYNDRYRFEFNNGIMDLSNKHFSSLSTATIITSTAFNENIRFQYSPACTFDIGGNVTQYRLTPVFKTYTDSTITKTLENDSQDFSEIAAYVENNWILKKNNRIKAGLRFTDVLYNKRHELSVEPRLSYQVLLNRNYSLSASLSSMSQPIHRVANSGLGIPFELFLPSLGELRPQKAWTASLGAGKELLLNNAKFTFKSDIWYKKLQNSVEFKDGFDAMDILLHQDNVTNRMDEFVCQGNGKAYGLDFSGNFSLNAVTVSADYTWMRATNHFNDLNNNKPFAASTDIRNALSLIGCWKISENLLVTANWMFQSGKPITVPTFISQIPSFDYRSGEMNYENGNALIINTERNNFRTKAFHKLDLTISRSLLLFNRYQGNVSLGVYNVYNRANAYMYYINTKKGNDGKLTPVLKAASIFPILPSASFSVKF